MLKIPVLPISYGDAQPLAGGARRPGGARARWRGSLPITYHLGPGPGAGAPRDQLGLGTEAALRRDRPDARQRDPESGWCAAITATAGCSAPGIRCPARWPCSPRPRPSARCSRAAGSRKRTLVYASWDGEEPGAARLDRVGRGARRGAADTRRCCTSTPTPTPAASSRPRAAIRCSACVNDVAGTVTDPETGVRHASALRARMLVRGLREESG